MEFKFSPHIAIQVKDYENACTFYKNILGFKELEIKKNETHFEKGDLNFYIENEPTKEKTFFEFKVENVANAILLLEQNGCLVTKKYSDKNAMIQDPYGMSFHIFEEGADIK
jgi:catechol 2,3-dioxygenase-like lactoylglutathione lyase family enzyme